MVKKINVLKARQQLDQLLEGVSVQGDQYIIEQAGKPLAAVVPVWCLTVWQQHREQFFAMLEAVQARHTDVAPEVLEHDVAEAVQQVRRDLAQRRA